MERIKNIASSVLTNYLAHLSFVLITFLFAGAGFSIDRFLEGNLGVVILLVTVIISSATFLAIITIMRKKLLSCQNRTDVLEQDCSILTQEVSSKEQIISQTNEKLCCKETALALIERHSKSVVDTQDKNNKILENADDKRILSMRIVRWTNPNDERRRKLRNLISDKITNDIEVKRLWQLRNIDDFKEMLRYLNEFKMHPNYNLACFCHKAIIMPEILICEPSVASVSLPKANYPYLMDKCYHFKGADDVKFWIDCFHAAWANSTEIWCRGNKTASKVKNILDGIELEVIGLTENIEKSANQLILVEIAKIKEEIIQFLQEDRNE